MVNEQARRLQQWILENTEDWLTICGLNEQPISEERFLELFHELISEGFHELPYVLIVNHYYAISEKISDIVGDIKDIVRTEHIRRETH